MTTLNSKLITIIGSLAEASLEYVGKNGDFAKMTVKIATGETHYELKSAGGEALMTNALVGAMQMGTRVKAVVELTARRAPPRNPGDAPSVFEEFRIVSIGEDDSGTQGGRGTLSGYVKGVVTKPGKNGDFKIPQIGLLLADRDGIIPDYGVEVRFPRDGGDEAVANWEAHIGQAVEIDVETDAYVASSGRSYPRYIVKAVRYSEMPEYMNDVLGLSPDLSTAI